MNPKLEAAFDAIEAAGVRWCVLRGEVDAVRPRGDVDVLASRSDLGGELPSGWLARKAWGHGSHRFFVTYDEDADAWLHLDVVSELRFGPHQSLATDAAAAVLDRAAGHVAADDDAFWALLLHCVLDRGDVPERHARRLQLLASHATDASPLALLPADARALAERGDWDSVLALAARAQVRVRPLARLANAALRRSFALQVLLQARGISVALLGPDGAGKSTLAASLARTFGGLPVRVYYAGMYAQDAPRGLARFVRLGRLALAIRRDLLRGRLVVIDRHPLEGALDRRGPVGLLKRALLRAAVPAPQVTVVLDAPGEVMVARKNEHDVATLERQRSRYRAIADRTAASVVDATANPGLVRRRVTALIWNAYARRA